MPKDAIYCPSSAISLGTGIIIAASICGIGSQELPAVETTWGPCLPLAICSPGNWHVSFSVKVWSYLSFLEQIMFLEGCAMSERAWLLGIGTYTQPPATQKRQSQLLSLSDTCSLQMEGKNSELLSSSSLFCFYSVSRA